MFINVWVFNDEKIRKVNNQQAPVVGNFFREVSVSVGICDGGIDPSSKIASAGGEIEIGRVKPGDRILTQEEGFRRVIWVARTQANDLAKRAMVHIPDGALENTSCIRMALRQRLILPNSSSVGSGRSLEEEPVAAGLVGLNGISVHWRYRQEFILIGFDRPFTYYAGGLRVRHDIPTINAIEASLFFSSANSRNCGNRKYH